MNQKTIHIEINCDVGEGVGNEKDILPLISSCNVACGGHAGDSKSMLEVALLAKKHKVKVGAHPSYPDIANFGRVSLDISSEQLKGSIESQIKEFVAILHSEKMVLNHIKPHGALYNDVAKDLALSQVFLEAIVAFKDTVFLYAPYASVIAEEALKQGFKIKYEAFGDRNYNQDFSLISRGRPDAVITNPKKILQHIVPMVIDKKLLTLDGGSVRIEVDTFCIHGDTPNALQILTYLSQELPNHNIYINRG